MKILKNSLLKTIFILLYGVSSLHLSAADRPASVKLPPDMKNIIAQLASQETDFDTTITKLKNFMFLNKEWSQLFSNETQLNILLKNLSDSFKKVPASFIAYALGGIQGTQHWLEKHFEDIATNDQERLMALLNEITQDESTIKSILGSKYLTQLAETLGTPAILELYDTIHKQEDTVRALNVKWFENAGPKNIVDPLKNLAILLIKIPHIRNYDLIRKKGIPDREDFNDIRNIITSLLTVYIWSLSDYFKDKNNKSLSKDLDLGWNAAYHISHELAYPSNEVLFKMDLKR